MTGSAVMKKNYECLGGMMRLHAKWRVAIIQKLKSCHILLMSLKIKTVAETIL